MQNRRCPWPTDEANIAYHDEEWGVPSHDDRHLFEMLILEGAPGYEHTFLKRALGQDPGLDVDAVVRKGQNDDGRDTFYVQADPSRMAGLSSGYPSKGSELFG